MKAFEDARMRIRTGRVVAGWRAVRLLLCGLGVFVGVWGPGGRLDAALIEVGEEVANFGWSVINRDVFIPFSITNDNQGTEYVRFELSSFAPLFQQIYNFGQNSTNFSSLEAMLTGQTASKNNLNVVLDSSPDMVRNGWMSSTTSSGSIVFEEIDPGEGDTWTSNMDSGTKHPFGGTLRFTGRC